MSYDRLSELIRRHLESIDLEPGRVHHLEIQHDDGCAYWNGQPCDCEPSIVSGPATERKHHGERES